MYQFTRLSLFTGRKSEYNLEMDQYHFLLILPVQVFVLKLSTDTDSDTDTKH